ncbi:hypothetical protein [Mycobacterium sp. M23085]|uniref:hypothetical protein n=1 Tax=Mycobacterium sp. M23085 TaxID=3378087 RepID=UPI003877EA29
MSDVNPEFIEAVSRETAVPAWLLQTADSPLDIWHLAQAAVDWKARTSPPPAPPSTAAVSAAVPYGPVPQQPVPADMTVMEAYRGNHFADRGAPAPPARRSPGKPW